jgi:DNA-binding CsgD family transcriptional regulator
MAAVKTSERFWSKVDKGPDCWVWTASTIWSGRGQFSVGTKMVGAHRVAWELTYGHPPAGLLRSHCGNLRCVRPDHQVIAEQRGLPRSLARPPVVRFWAAVQQGPSCWLWTGSVNRGGCGQFRDRSRVRQAHRYAWELAYGQIPAGADVVHRCGTRLCVRPDHLKLRRPTDSANVPTPRELEILQAYLQLGMTHGSLKKVAADLGVSYWHVTDHLWTLRTKIGVEDNRRAVAWLDEHEPGWRLSGPTDASEVGPA